MAGPISLYFDAWAANDLTGTSLGHISEATDKQIQTALNETGVGRFSINRYGNASQVSWCATGNLIRVRTVAGGPFAYNHANYKYAFFIEDTEDDVVNPDEEGGAIWTRGGRGILAVLERLVWYDVNFMGAAGARDDGKWHFPNSTVGAIAARMIDEWNARPSPKPMPATLTKTFSSSVDTEGTTWPAPDPDEDILIEIGTDYLTTLGFLGSQGLEFEMSPAFALSAYVEDGKGTDKTATHAFRRDWNIRDDSSRTTSGAKRRTRALTKGVNADGEPVYVEAMFTGTAADEAAIGRSELFVDAGNLIGPPLGKAGRQALLVARRKAIGPLTLAVSSYLGLDGVSSDGGSPPAKRDYLPFTDYVLGDNYIVDIPGEYGGTPHRITEISIYDTENGEADVAITFGGQPGPMGSGSMPGMTVGQTGSGHTHPCCVLLCDATVLAGFGVPDCGMGGFFADVEDAFDGDPDTYASGVTSLNTHGSNTLTWCYAEEVTADGFTLSQALLADYGGAPGMKHAASGWELQYTNDLDGFGNPHGGSVWITAYDRAHSAWAAIERVAFAPVTTRHWRLVDTNEAWHDAGGGVDAANGWVIHEAELTSSSGEGHPDLVGTADDRAARCDHSHHVTSATPPTASDDESIGYPVSTLWTDTTTGRTYMLTDATAGAAVWTLIAVTVIEDLTTAETDPSLVLSPDGAGGLEFRRETGALLLHIDGGGWEIVPSGATGILDIPVPFDLTFVGWTLVADQVGSLVIDVWKDSYANYPATDADSITNGHEPALSAAIKAQDAAITDWAGEAVAAGSVLRFNVDSASTVQRATLSLEYTKGI